MTKPKVVFITDLDRTIIHSKNPGEPVVEWMKTENGQRAVTHMTETSQRQLSELLANPKFLFIPCTMRNQAQVERVGFIKSYQPEYMICTNGAQIYRNGELDLTWEKKMRLRVPKEMVVKDRDQLETLELPTVEIRITEGFYLTLKFESDKQSEEAYAMIRSAFSIRERQVVRVGRKIFIMHPSIDKVHAVDYLMQGQSWEDSVYTSGDSDVDQWFVTRGQAILPAHSSFKGGLGTRYTKQSGIKATEEILDYLTKVLNEA